MSLLKSVMLLSVCVGASVTALNPEGLQTLPDSLMANGDVCKDCTQIFELLSDLLSNEDLQKKIIDGIESLCKQMPGAAGKICKEEVEKMFPMAITFLTTVIKPSQVCQVIGLCKGREKQEVLRYIENEAFQLAAVSGNVEPANQCSFCIMLIKTLEGLLPEERTEDAVIKLLGEICRILPSAYHTQCQAVVGKFSKVVLDAILSYATPQAICALLRMCKGQDAPLLDPCTLPTYRCRDIRTAMSCGTLFFCQKFDWKAINKF